MFLYHEKQNISMKRKYAEHLVIITIGIVAAAALILIAYTYIIIPSSSPQEQNVRYQFTEDYCKTLLAKNDPSIDGTQFVDSNGTKTFASIGVDSARTAVINTMSGTVSDCSVTIIGAETAMRGGLYACGNDTTSYITQETASYLMLQKVVKRSTGTDTPVYQNTISYYSPDFRNKYDDDLQGVMLDVTGCTRI
jgi:hypothetical protein